MARKRRIIYPGYCYHVMLRGVGGRMIFNDNRDRAKFCLLLQYASETCGFSIHGFCLMSNHVHLILQPHTSDLSTGMHRLAFRYAQYFNGKMERQGYLFQSRFKAVIVEHGSYLRCLIRYVHRNPVRANMVSHVSRYPWSSHQAYKGKAAFTWLKMDLVLGLFGSETSDPLNAFEKYVCAKDNDVQVELEDIRKSMSVGAYGSESFVEDFREELKSSSLVSSQVGLTQDKAKNSLKTSPVVTPEVTIEDILDDYLKKVPYSLEELQSASRKISLVDARAILAWLVSALGAGRRQQVATLLRRDPTSVGRLEERVLQLPKLRDSAEEWKALLLSRQ